MTRNPKFLESIYKSIVRPRLEYCVQAWNPVYSGDVIKMEAVQNRFTRLLNHGSVMTPTERNAMLHITDHETRRRRGDLIYTYKMLEKDSLFRRSTENRTRGNSKKLIIERCSNNIRKHYFSVRNVPQWNNLPEQVVSAESVNIFKNRLDEFWNNI